MTTDGPATSGVLIRGLTVRVGGRTLLENVDAEFPAGKTTLVVGPSGAGKSVLLRILAGLVNSDERDFEISGGISLGAVNDPQGDDQNGSNGGGQPRVGIVFQNFALFDELSAVGNILFGWHHGPKTHANGATGVELARHLLGDLQVPTTIPVDLLSGGQKQRLAIARTLAFDPDVIVFDEPTSGLDPINSKRVADRIRHTQEAFGKTTVIVTHDYETLLDNADCVYLLDPGARSLVPVDHDELRTRGLAAPASADVEESAPSKRIFRSAAAGGLGWVERVFTGTTGAVEAAVACLAFLLPWWRSARWGLRYLWHYLWLIASPSSFAYFGAAGIIAGFVATHFTFKFLPFKAYTEELLTEELLHGLGFSLYRIVIPVLMTVLLAARCGAAIAADVGSRVYNRQIEAMRSLGAPPRPYLLTNILYAFLLATPILVLFGFAIARLTSLAVFAYNYPEHSHLFWDAHFHADLREPAQQLLFRGTGWLLTKVLACGVGVGAIAYHVGIRPKRSGVEVSRGITATIIWATLFVLLVHFAFAFLEF